MPSEDDVAAAARKFLSAVATAARDDLGGSPVVHERVQWWEPRPDGKGATLTSHDRETLDRDAVMAWWRARGQPLPERTHLEAYLSSFDLAGTTYGIHWIDPLLWYCIREAVSLNAITEVSVATLAASFAAAVCSQRVRHRSRVGIAGLPITATVPLAPGVSIRPITERELWDFGARGDFFDRRDFDEYPSTAWSVLESELEVSLQDSVHAPAAIHETERAFAAVLALTFGTAFELTQLGDTVDFGMNAAGYTVSPPLQQKLSSGRVMVGVEESDILLMQQLFPRVRSIVADRKNYLHLPLNRLVTGEQRRDGADAVLDFVIGLEALLTGNDSGEVTYKLALRGATVVTWDGGPKRAAFAALKKLYGTRSAIAHGRATAAKIHELKTKGEWALRLVLRWFIEQNPASPEQAIAMIESRFLD